MQLRTSCFFTCHVTGERRGAESRERCCWFCCCLPADAAAASCGLPGISFVFLLFFFFVRLKYRRSFTQTSCIYFCCDKKKYRMLMKFDDVMLDCGNKFRISARFSPHALLPATSFDCGRVTSFRCPSSSSTVVYQRRSRHDH